MKHNRIKRAILLISAFALCGSLTACGGKSNMTAEEFLTAVQTQNFTAAITYMDDSNHLNRVFDAVDGTSVPELDEVYRAFAGQMGEMTYEILGSGEEAGQFNVRVQNKDYDAAISEAMNAAIQDQTESGSDAFSNYAGWLSQGVSQASMGEADEGTLTVTKEDSGSSVKGTGNKSFLNLLTGGFYDYADLSMTTCTLKNEEQESTYYIAALGDKVIGCIMTDAALIDLSDVSEEDLALLVEEQERNLRGMKGIYGKVIAGDNRVSTTVGVDFTQAEQASLITMGLIDGSSGYNEYLSLKVTIEGFESQGMSCVTVPQYP